MAESFTIDDETSKLLRAMQKAFRARDNADVLRRAIGLAMIAAEKADAAHLVVMQRPGDPASAELITLDHQD